VIQHEVIVVCHVRHQQGHGPTAKIDRQGALVEGVARTPSVTIEKVRLSKLTNKRNPDSSGKEAMRAK
jgi:hypothetical protein